jgi:hypothetical protein
MSLAEAPRAVAQPSQNVTDHTSLTISGRWNIGKVVFKLLIRKDEKIYLTITAWQRAYNNMGCYHIR